MQSTGDEERKRKDEEDREYLTSYIRHLENRIKVIETDNQDNTLTRRWVPRPYM